MPASERVGGVLLETLPRRAWKRRGTRSDARSDLSNHDFALASTPQATGSVSNDPRQRLRGPRERNLAVSLCFPEAQKKRAAIFPSTATRDPTFPTRKEVA